jgi:hypothetical protein
MGDFRCSVIRVRYHCRTGQFPQVRTTSAKPSGDHIPLAALFIVREKRMRYHWMKVVYLLAIALAMIGWLWFIGWCAFRLI